MNVKQLGKVLRSTVSRLYNSLGSSSYFNTSCLNQFNKYLEACETYDFNRIVTAQIELNNANSKLILNVKPETNTNINFIVGIVNLLAEDIKMQMIRDIEEDLPFLTDKQKEQVLYHLDELRQDNKRAKEEEESDD